MNEVTLAVVGCGKWGINHVKTAHRLLGNRLKYCSDNTDESKAAVNAVSDKIIFTTDLNDILNDESVNAVIVSTPAETHFEIAKALLLKGKN
ncbi:MAG: Gfo/Idh/MocA family oxidoreductase, partial [Ignavibacteria bacterium]